MIVNFKPQIWSAELLVSLERSLVYASPLAVNRNYEGEISAAGDSVRIVSLTDPTVGTYTPHTDITVEDVDDILQSLLIDQSKYFAFEVDDIEMRQATSNVMPEQIRKAAFKLRSVADSYVAGLMSTGRDAGNQLAEVTISTPAAAYEKLVDLSVILDEDDVPEDERFAIVTPKFYGLLLKDSRFVGDGSADGAATRANGYVGQAAGLWIMKSNNVPDGPGVGAGKNIIVGHNMALT